LLPLFCRPVDRAYYPETRRVGSTSHCLQRELRFLPVSGRSRHATTVLTRPARTSATVLV